MPHEISSIALVVGLFLLGVVSPGPNFLVVAERAMASGFRDGLITGLGVAVGDGLYAAAGLLGMTAILSRLGWLLGVVKIVGGLYIVWIGLSMIVGWRRRPSPGSDGRRDSEASGSVSCFRRGLLTDLSNPKTIVFFTGIFGATYDPGHPDWVLASMWAGVVVASVSWRTGLALVFSREAVREAYRRFRRGVETLFGGALALLGIRLAFTGRLR